MYQPHDINKTVDQGGGIVKEQERITFNDLVKKVKQQEEVITQLVEIIATTNHIVSDIVIKQKESENGYLLS